LALIYSQKFPPFTATCYLRAGKAASVPCPDSSHGIWHEDFK